LEQGRLLGLLGAIGLERANAMQRDLWVQEALATAAIEGEQLNLASLRLSVVHRLALADAPGADRSVDGLVQVMQDALNHAQRLRGITPDASTIDATPWVYWFVQAFTRACITSQAVVRGATNKAQCRLRAAQCHINSRQSKVLERLLDAGHVGSGGGFVVSPPGRPKVKRASSGGSEPHEVGSVEALFSMTNEKYAKVTGTSKATATRDLADLLAHGLLRVEGVGKATRYAVNVPGWEPTVLKP